MSKFNSQSNHYSNKNRKSSKDIVGSYFQDIIRIPLLTPEEEIYLAKQVQQRMSLLAIKEELSKELQHQPTLQEWSDKAQLNDSELLEQINQGQIAKQKMITANLRLVVTIAKKYQKRNLDFPDLIQEGTLGLERAVDKFKHTQLQDLLVSESYSPFDYVVKESLKQTVQDLLSKLSPQQQEILTLRFGLTGEEELTLK